MNRSRLLFPMIAVMALAAACVMPPPPGPTTTTTSTTTTTAPPADADNDGFNTLSDCDDNDASIYPGAPDPAGDDIDSNCDGIDGVQSAAIFVNSTTGGDTSTCGVITEPCATIGQGLARAGAESKTSVFVAGGTYAKFSAVAGIEVRGGYGQNYQRGIAATGSTTATVNASFDAAAGGPVALIADGITTSTKIADLRLVGGTASAGQVATTVLVRNSTSALSLDSLQILGGTGGVGVNGAAGTSASSSPASSGQGGGNGSEPGGACNNSTSGGGGAGVGGGGNGGSGGTVDTNCGIFSLNLNARGGNGGGNGSGASGSSGIGGGGGQAGTDGLPGICTIGGGPAVNGLPGTNGAAGANGTAGTGGAPGAAGGAGNL
ncbi:MAG: putative metal-binding motif-containing protein, partial [Actinomycetota bacterium]